LPPPPLNALKLTFPDIDTAALSGANVIQGWEEFGTGDVVAATIAELDAVPAALVQVAPQVTQVQRKLSVYAELRVDRSGHVTSVTILESDDHRLNEPVLRAVRKWQFQPGMQNGQVVPFLLRQRFHFAP
jgi:TonB family protein